MKHLFFAFLLLAALVTGAAAAAGPTDLPWVYSTYLGSESEDQGASVALDTQGRATVTGYTSGTSFPALSGPRAPQHGVDVFATRFDANGAAVSNVYWFNALTLFAEDEGYSVALDAQGNAVFDTFEPTGQEAPVDPPVPPTPPPPTPSGSPSRSAGRTPSAVAG